MLYETTFHMLVIFLILRDKKKNKDLKRTFCVLGAVLEAGLEGARHLSHFSNRSEWRDGVLQ